MASTLRLAVILEQARDATGQPLGRREVEKLVGSVRVGLGTEHARDEELVNLAVVFGILDGKHIFHTTVPYVPFYDVYYRHHPFDRTVSCLEFRSRVVHRSV